MGKQIASVPVKAIDTLKWGALGPVVKSLTPALKPVATYLKLGPASEKYAVIIPGSLITGKGIYDNGKLTLEANKAIDNIEKALVIARKEQNQAHTQVLEQMLKEAKEQRWSHVLTLARSSVGIVDTVRKALTPATLAVSNPSLSSITATNSQAGKSQTTNSGSSIIMQSNGTPTMSSSTESATRTFTYSSSSSSSRSTSSISSPSSKTTTTNSGPTTKVNVEMKSSTDSEVVYVGKNFDTRNLGQAPVPASPTPAVPLSPQISPPTQPTTPPAGSGSTQTEFQVDKTITGVIKNVKSGYSDEVGKQESEQKLKEKEKAAEEIKSKLEGSKEEVKKLEQEIKEN
jgi:hypothetical protein